MFIEETHSSQGPVEVYFPFLSGSMDKSKIAVKTIFGLTIYLRFFDRQLLENSFYINFSMVKNDFGFQVGSSSRVKAHSHAARGNEYAKMLSKAYGGWGQYTLKSWRSSY